MTYNYLSYIQIKNIYATNPTVLYTCKMAAICSKDYISITWIFTMEFPRRAAGFIGSVK